MTSGIYHATPTVIRTLARVAGRVKDRRLMEVARVLRGGAPSLDLDELAFAIIESLSQADPGEQGDLLEAERLLAHSGNDRRADAMGA